MKSAAVSALTHSEDPIKISVAFVPTSGDNDGQAAILLEVADISGGAFITTTADGTGTADAIIDIIENCGEGEDPTPSADPVCPDEYVQHWDKIAFSISDPRLADRVNLTANTTLDIKILDDPLTVADLEKKVLDFLKVPDNPQFRDALRIIDTEYAIVCSEALSPTIGKGRELVVPPELAAERLATELGRLQAEQGGNQ